MPMSSRAKISALTTAVVLGAVLGTTERAGAQYNGSWITPENTAQAKPAAPAQDEAAKSVTPASTWDVKETTAKGVAKDKDAAAKKSDAGKATISAKDGSAPKAAETKPADTKAPAKKTTATKTPAVQAAGTTAAEPKSAAKMPQSSPAADEKARSEAAAPLATHSANDAASEKASQPSKTAGEAAPKEKATPQTEAGVGTKPDATAAANNRAESAVPVAGQSPVALGAAPEESTNAQAAEPAQAPESAQQPGQLQSAATEEHQALADTHHSNNTVHAAPGLFVVLPNEVPISRQLLPEQ